MSLTSPARFRPLLLALLVGPLGVTVLTGCSTFSSSEQNAKAALAGDEDDYRDREESLSQSLEVPPDLITPQQKNSDISALLSPQSSSLEKDYRNIPQKQFNGITVRTNLSERWIEVPKADAQRVWQEVQSFLVSLGFTVKEANKTFGVIKTNYKARTELAPIDTQGPLTRLLNSWRPELAEGVYDRLTARVETDDAGNVRVYFYDHVLYRQDDGDIDSWQVRPYSPEVEAEALYQAMVFLGVGANEAFQKVQSTAHLIKADFAEDATTADGRIFDGVLLKVPFGVAWTYVKAMVYRAGWTLLKADDAKHVLEAKLPKELSKSQKGWLSSLFSSEEGQAGQSPSGLPERVLLKLEPLSQSEKGKDLTAQEVQLLTANVPEDESPMRPKQQEALFKVLGILTE
jgi:outer membrane protein assembly factor BamC